MTRVTPSARPAAWLALACLLLVIGSASAAEIPVDFQYASSSLPPWELINLTRPLPPTEYLATVPRQSTWSSSLLSLPNTANFNVSNATDFFSIRMVGLNTYVDAVKVFVTCRSNIPVSWRAVSSIYNITDRVLYLYNTSDVDYTAMNNSIAVRRSTLPRPDDMEIWNDTATKNSGQNGYKWKSAAPVFGYRFATEYMYSRAQNEALNSGIWNIRKAFDEDTNITALEAADFNMFIWATANSKTTSMIKAACNVILQMYTEVNPFTGQPVSPVAYTFPTGGLPNNVTVPSMGPSAAVYKMAIKERDVYLKGQFPATGSVTLGPTSPQGYSYMAIEVDVHTDILSDIVAVEALLSCDFSTSVAFITDWDTTVTWANNTYKAMVAFGEHRNSTGFDRKFTILKDSHMDYQTIFFFVVPVLPDKNFQAKCKIRLRASSYSLDVLSRYTISRDMGARGYDGYQFQSTTGSCRNMDYFFETEDRPITAIVPVTTSSSTPTAFTLPDELGDGSLETITMNAGESVVLSVTPVNAAHDMRRIDMWCRTDGLQVSLVLAATPNGSPVNASSQIIPATCVQSWKFSRPGKVHLSAEVDASSSSVKGSYFYLYGMTVDNQIEDYAMDFCEMFPEDFTCDPASYCKNYPSDFLCVTDRYDYCTNNHTTVYAEDFVTRNASIYCNAKYCKTYPGLLDPICHDQTCTRDAYSTPSMCSRCFADPSFNTYACCSSNPALAWLDEDLRLKSCASEYGPALVFFGENCNSTDVTGSDGSDLDLCCQAMSFSEDPSTLTFDDSRRPATWDDDGAPLTYESTNCADYFGTYEGNRTNVLKSAGIPIFTANATNAKRRSALGVADDLNPADASMPSTSRRLLEARNGGASSGIGMAAYMHKVRLLARAERAAAATSGTSAAASGTPSARRLAAELLKTGRRRLSPAEGGTIHRVKFLETGDTKVSADNDNTDVPFYYYEGLPTASPYKLACTGVATTYQSDTGTPANAVIRSVKKALFKVAGAVDRVEFATPHDEAVPFKKL